MLNLYKPYVLQAISTNERFCDEEDCFFQLAAHYHYKLYTSYFDGVFISFNPINSPVSEIERLAQS